MSLTLIHGKYIVTGTNDDNTDLLVDSGIIEKDGFITEIGNYESLSRKYPNANKVGGNQYLVMPGLVNAHHHGNGLSPLHLGISDESLEPWIVRRMALTPVDTYLSACYAAIKLLESGTTTVMVNQSPGSAAHLEEDSEAMLKAFKDSGLRICYSLGYRQQNRIVYEDDSVFLKKLPSDLSQTLETILDAGYLSPEEYFTFYDDLIKKLDGSKDHVRIALSPSNLQWCSDEFLREVKAYASTKKLPIHMHLLETIYQKEYAFRTFGKSAVEHLEEIQFLDETVSLAHAVWLTERDVEMVASLGPQICHNASSNLKLQSGIAPIQNLLSNGATVALGTDSMSLNDDDDLFQDMRLTAQLHRNTGIGATVPTAKQILTMATVNGAKATGFEGEIGRLSTGYRADLVLLNLNRISESPIKESTNPLEAVIYLANKQDVDTVIIGGQVVVQNGQALLLDRSETSAKLKENASRKPTIDEIKKNEQISKIVAYVSEFYRDWNSGVLEPHYRYNGK